MAARHMNNPVADPDTGYTAPRAHPRNLTHAHTNP
jgi:hypothetical protein